MFCCAAALVWVSSAEIIDRIAVSVGASVITSTEIDREIRVTALINGAKPDLGPASRRATAERLIDQSLIRHELDLSHYPIPDAAAAEPLLAQFRKTRFPDDAAFHQKLTDYGITEQDLKDELLWQQVLLRFIEVRFRPAVDVTDKDIENYFDDVVRPAAIAAKPNQPVSIDDFRSQIEERLVGDRADQELNRWLRDTRLRTEIVYQDSALAPQVTP